jgi:hypothetical protein
MKKLNRIQLRNLVESVIYEEADKRVKFKDLKPKGKVLRILSIGIAPLKKKGVKFIKGEKLAEYYKEQVGEEGVDEDSKKALGIIAKQMGGADANAFVAIPGDPKYAYVIQADNKTAKAFVLANGNMTKVFKIPPGGALAYAAGMHQEGKDKTAEEIDKYEEKKVTGPIVKMVEEMLKGLDTQPKTSALNIARAIALANGKDPKGVKVGDMLKFPNIGSNGFKSYDDFYNEITTQNESLSRGSLYRNRYYGRY